MRQRKGQECDLCHRPIRKRYWFGLVVPVCQCERAWCRFRSGHWFWLTFGARIVWRWPEVAWRWPKIVRGPPGFL
jgi:hypothetical protein